MKPYIALRAQWSLSLSSITSGASDPLKESLNVSRYDAVDDVTVDVLTSDRVARKPFDCCWLFEVKVSIARLLSDVKVNPFRSLPQYLK